jgi:hypothetical protein
MQTREEVKKYLLDEIDQLKEATYPEDMVAEIADSLIPIYYSEIIKEWIRLDSEFMDRWKEYGYDTQKNEGGILQLMQVDLSFYYIETALSVWEEIKKELEEGESEE